MAITGRGRGDRALSRTSAARAGPAGKPTVGMREREEHDGDLRSLDGVDDDTAEGGTLGLRGHHGAGWSTADRILAERCRPTERRADALGHDVVRYLEGVRRLVDLVPVMPAPAELALPPRAERPRASAVAVVDGHPFVGARPHPAAVAETMREAEAEAHTTEVAS